MTGAEATSAFWFVDGQPPETFRQVRQVYEVTEPLTFPETFPETFPDMFEEPIKPEAHQTLAEPGEQERFPYQKRVCQCYNDDRIQIFVAILIFMNFFMECAQRQIDPDPNQLEYKSLWKGVEYFFTFAFLIELLVNMYGSWTPNFPKFLKSAWNYFDMFVVAVGILLLIVPELPGPLNFVKMCRAFRVFRLFGRIASLKKIISSIEKAIPGVVNAFIIMVLVVCIYAVLAVDLYGEYYTMVDRSEPGAVTSRGQIYGEEYYGTFVRALYTLFQILTGESWSELGVRPVLELKADDLTETLTSVLFFTSFVLINGIILLNVVVAVLLDGMAAAAEEHNQHSKEKTEAENGELSDEKQDINVQDIELKQEVSNMKAEVGEMKLKLKEALALIRKDTANGLRSRWAMAAHEDVSRWAMAAHEDVPSETRPK